MKYLKLLGLVLCAVPSLLMSQDIIVLKNADEIKSRVIEITDVTVKYKKWENINGPTYNMNKNSILFIRYENGTKEVFTNSTEPLSESGNSPKSEEKKPIVNEPIEIYSTSEQPNVDSPKRKIHASFELGGEYLDNTLTDYGIKSEGYGIATNVGLSVYRFNKMELGLKLNGRIGYHDKSYTRIQFGQTMAQSMNNASNSNDWSVLSYDWDNTGQNTFLSPSAGAGIYLTDNKSKYSYSGSFLMGSQLVMGIWNNVMLESDAPHYDYLQMENFVIFKPQVFINPSFSFIIGKSTKSKPRLSINIDYKTMWLIIEQTTYVDGTIYGTNYYEMIDENPIVKRTGMLNIGIGITGF